MIVKELIVYLIIKIYLTWFRMYNNVQHLDGTSTTRTSFELVIATLLSIFTSVAFYSQRLYRVASTTKKGPINRWSMEMKQIRVTIPCCDPSFFLFLIVLPHCFSFVIEYKSNAFTIVQAFLRREPQPVIPHCEKILESSSFKCISLYIIVEMRIRLRRVTMMVMNDTNWASIVVWLAAYSSEHRKAAIIY